MNRAAGLKVNNKVKIKSVLISQPEPKNVRSPFYDLKDKYNIKIDFRPFIVIEGVSVKEFRKEKIDILEHTAVVMTSRTSIEHFFRICEGLKLEVPADMKYFCVTEAVALYLQKYITYRKRKVFFFFIKDKVLEDYILKHKGEKYLIPKSNVSKNDLPDYLKKKKIKYTEATMYKTVANDLSDLKNVNYDILAFFSPSGIDSLFENFPDFKQNNTKIAAFGPSTCQAVIDRGLNLDIQAPSPQAPSMKMALEQYIIQQEK